MNVAAFLGMGRSIMKRMGDAPRAGVATAVNLGRATRELALALPRVGRRLPGVVEELHRVLANLARLTSDDGELTVLLRQLARSAAVATPGQP